jgi:hypothetical protein
MKPLRLSITVTALLGFFSILALIFQFLALADIAHQEADLSLEWKINGICMMIYGLFIISTFISIGLMLKGIKTTAAV